MKVWITLTFCLALLAAAAPAQYWHDTQYLLGGAASIFLVKGDGSMRTVVSKVYTVDDFCMDVDNYHILAVCQGPMYQTTLFPSRRFGVFRFDPQTGLHQTLYGPDPDLCWNLGGIHVDYNGDYVFTTHARTPTNPAPNAQVMKLGRNGAVSTIFTSAILGHPAQWCGKMHRNINTGRILLQDMCSRIGPNFLRYPILEFGLDGTASIWSTGGAWGWDDRTSLPQNHSNGYVEGPYMNVVYRIKPGTSCRTTLGTIYDGHGMPSCCHFGGKFDLQTGLQRRWVSATHFSGPGGYSGWLCYTNPLLKLTSVQLATTPAAMQYKTFEFFRGRHIQTVRMEPHRWSILLSCPRSPGYPYVLGAGVSGVRPAIHAPGFRRINICPDPVLLATVHNQLPGIWKPGPGTLDTTGSARAELDLRSLKLPPGGIGTPLWLALVVLDPKSPGGIKYVPDTYVMRI